MATIPTGLITAPLQSSVTVFLVGVQCRSLFSLWKLPFIAKRMGKMQEELRNDPDSGLLWGANFIQFSPMTTLFLSYWKSSEHIHRFVESDRFSHKQASPEYFRRWGKDPNLGVWHETYEIQPGQEENLYFGMAPFGMSAIQEVVQINSQNRTYLKRLRRNKMESRLKSYGPYAVITGASDGMGKAIAELLAEAGLSVVLVARREHILMDLAEKLRQLYQIKVEIIPADLSDSKQRESVIEKTSHLDVGILINAAGFGTSGEFTKNSFPDELSMLQVNCEATLQLTHSFSRRMKKREHGAIVLFGSLVGFQGVPGAAHYAATKAYVQTLGEGLERELSKDGIRVLTVAPGPVETGFGRRAKMKMSVTDDAMDVAKGIVASIGRTGTIRPGFYSKLLGYSLMPLLRGLRTRIMEKIMRDMVGGNKT